MHDYMPGRIFWKTAGITAGICSVVLWLFVALGSEITQKNLVEENAWRSYRHELYRAVSGDADVSPQIQEIANYLLKNIGEFDDIVAREKRISDTVRHDSERTTLHVQNPQHVPMILLTMSRSEYWHKLRDDAKSLQTLKGLLQKEGSVPPLELVSTVVSTPGWWPLAILIPQFLGFCAYFFRWVGSEWSFTDRHGMRTRDFCLASHYRWYGFSWPVRLSMVLLLPGAAPMIAVMLLGSKLYDLPETMRAWKRRRHMNATIAHGGGERLHALLSKKLRRGGNNDVSL